MNHFTGSFAVYGLEPVIRKCSLGSNINQFELDQFVSLWNYPPEKRYLDIAFVACNVQGDNDCLVNQCAELQLFAERRNALKIHLKKGAPRDFVFDTIRTGRAQTVPTVSTRTKHKMRLPRGWGPHQVRRFISICYCNTFTIDINGDLVLLCNVCKDEYHFNCARKHEPNLTKDAKDFTCQLCKNGTKVRSWRLDMPALTSTLPKNWWKL